MEGKPKPWLNMKNDFRPWENTIPTVTVNIPGLIPPNSFEAAGNSLMKVPVDGSAKVEAARKSNQITDKVSVQPKDIALTEQLSDMDEDVEEGEVLPNGDVPLVAAANNPLGDRVEQYTKESKPALLFHSIVPKNMKKKSKKKLEIKCNRCQYAGHKMKDCKAEKDINGNLIQRMKCVRCGRYGHSKETCVTDTHFNGTKLEDTVYCARCLRSGHVQKTCIAKVDKNRVVIKRVNIQSPNNAPQTANPDDNAQRGILSSIFDGCISQSEQREPKRLEENAILVETKKVPEHRPKPRQKTGICNMWKQGKCILGDSCNFLHIGPGFDPRTKQLCTFYRNGSCMKGSSCEYSHIKKDFPCAFHFLKQSKGGCQKDDCEYSHDPITKEQEEYFMVDQEMFERKRALSE
ncbi:hypothetical protein HDV01_006393 [Terramyces sp. JEL0728]|nr:hypothetical protein HDV01_006393 [Terramyces sp. JEL0728]